MLMSSFPSPLVRLSSAISTLLAFNTKTLSITSSFAVPSASTLMSFISTFSSPAVRVNLVKITL